MPYNSVKELPEAVRTRYKHKPKRLRQWMHVWNSSYDNHGSEDRAFAEAWATVQKRLSLERADMKKSAKLEQEVNPSVSIGESAPGSSVDFQFFLPISKIDKERRQISGYASTPTLDMDGEIVSLDAVKKALPGYWEWRNVREMHTNSAVGVAKEANVDGTGLFLTAKIVDDDAWKKCLEQVYKGFSIGGKKLAKTGNTITEIDLVEVSVVDRPANPDCRFEVQKRAKDLDESTPAYLVKMLSPEEKTLKKIYKALSDLEKRLPDNMFRNPPAARDGFSLPAKKVKKAKKDKNNNGNSGNGNSGEEVKENPFQTATAKRDVSTGERQSLASRGQALPGGGFPIKNKSDLDNARQAFGRAKDKPATAALIRRRARELGVKLPSGWSKKLAKRLIAVAEHDRLIKSLSVNSSFLDLEKESKPRNSVATSISTSTTSELGDYAMDSNSPNLDQFLAELSKRGAVPTRAQHLQIARTNMKKARKARNAAMSNIKECHAMHKASYLSKAGKSPKKDNVDSEFDHEDAMEKLSKAYGSLNSMKTFMKAANNHLKKAASRAGQRGQEASDSDSPWYQVPAGVKDLSPSDLSTAGPGGDGGGSEPPLHTLENIFPGKAAKKGAENGLITREHSDALIRAAAAEAEANLLKSMPAPVGRRPVAFDTTRLIGTNNGDVAANSLMNGVDPNGLSSEDESLRKSSVGRLIGNMITNGSGKSVFDPAFHGMAGASGR